MIEHCIVAGLAMMGHTYRFDAKSSGMTQEISGSWYRDGCNFCCWCC